MLIRNKVSRIKIKKESERILREVKGRKGKGKERKGKERKKNKNKKEKKEKKERIWKEKEKEKGGEDIEEQGMIKDK